ncbi:uncharacterized protein C11orf86 homolog [Sceloporus undulatus]|uniref:uncharacterized protein C11orf86 homolog n=1 Tax=Sceloporus undulatus TaxID=8520 RepID=UPI001C4DAF25|nr:uncharacterized protein C11orf86 homolog [Sceloporus undulatus]
MTNQRRLRRAWSSLRGPKTLSLLQASGSSRAIGPYGPLEEPEPTWGAREEEGSRQRTSPGRGGGGGQGKRGRSRRGESLRGRQKARQGAAAEEEGEPAAPGGTGEAAMVGTAQPLGTGDDGQMLLGEMHDQTGSRMRKRKKQVSHVLRRGWQTFMAGVYSLTLSRPASSPAPPVQPLGQEPGEGKEPPGPA